jgi:predicted ester cyclase
MSDVLVTATAGGALTPAPGTRQALVARPVIEFLNAVNRGDLDGAIAQLAPGALHHGRISNYRPEGVRVLFEMVRTVLPDLHLDIREMNVVGDKVITRVVGTGTHAGSYLGKAPTGRVLVWESVDIAEIEIRDAAEVETEFVTDAGPWSQILKRYWDLWNDPQLWKDIGFTPAIMC